MGLAYTSVYCLGLMSYFSENFGFSANETVALMGVHTMGRAATNNSGFEVSRVDRKMHLFYIRKSYDPKLIQKIFFLKKWKIQSEFSLFRKHF
jgi:hypothetical protein